MRQTGRLEWLLVWLAWLIVGAVAWLASTMMRVAPRAVDRYWRQQRS